MSPRFAVLVDGDNIGAQHAAHIRRIALARGSPDIWRVYADASLRKDWHDAPGFRLIHAGAGKNAADVLLAIDAMDLALRDGVSGFVIASSDGDFSHVAHRLRETGRCLIGVGEGKTPAAFRAACSAFEQIGQGQRQPAPDPLASKVIAMIHRHEDNGKGMRVAILGSMMHKTHAIGITALPDGNWRAYLENRSHLFDLDPKGSEARVRIRTAHLRAV